MREKHDQLSSHSRGRRGREGTTNEAGNSRYSSPKTHYYQVTFRPSTTRPLAHTKYNLISSHHRKFEEDRHHRLILKVVLFLYSVASIIHNCMTLAVGDLWIVLPSILQLVASGGGEL